MSLPLHSTTCLTRMRLSLLTVNAVGTIFDRNVPLTARRYEFATCRTLQGRLPKRILQFSAFLYESIRATFRQFNAVLITRPTACSAFRRSCFRSCRRCYKGPNNGGETRHTDTSSTPTLMRTSLGSSPGEDRARCSMRDSTPPRLVAA